MRQWDKAIVVFPPIPEDALDERWETFRQIVERAGVPADVWSGATADGVLTLVWSSGASPTMYTAGHRDEWEYEVALHAAVARLVTAHGNDPPTPLAHGDAVMTDAPRATARGARRSSPSGR